MSRKFNLVVIVGSTSLQSRTAALTKAIAAAVAQRVSVTIHTVSLHAIRAQIALADSAKDLSGAALEGLQQIENADLIIAGSPVYKGSYSGLFKHLIDLVNPDALVNVPVILSANGGGERHALVVEHQLRPLFAFFRAHTIPTSVYAGEAELAGYAVSSAGLQARIDEAATQAAQVLLQSAAAQAGHATGAEADAESVALAA